ncbi:MAG: hypothetical protein FWH40_08570 [Coriobacteriia bacterium]|nr:hypothetical protein [Coriobacteriia bacterium]
MKVDDLRAILAKYDLDTTRKLVVELYKLTPKRQRVEAGLDELITDFASTDRPARKQRANADLISDFPTLTSQAETFI